MSLLRNVIYTYFKKIALKKSSESVVFGLTSSGEVFEINDVYTVTAHLLPRDFIVSTLENFTFKNMKVKDFYWCGVNTVFVKLTLASPLIVDDSALQLYPELLWI
jgi:hypothetical protein